MTERDIQAVTFDKAMRGYQTEQVDNFLDEVALQLRSDAERMQELEKEKAAMQAEYDALKEKMYVLVKKIEDYRADEDNLKSALLNAQRMGENIVREAKQKAETIEREAKIRAEMIIGSVHEQRHEEEQELTRLHGEVAKFRANVLGMYRQHIELLSNLPVEEPAEEPAAQQEPEAPAPVESTPVAEPVAEPAEEKAPIFDFWEKDEKALEPVTVPEKPEAPAVPEAFRGIRFSD